MPTKIGHFEILSELAKSPTCTVYKANDPESGQTIALKAIKLSAFGDGAEALQQALLQEAENTKVLSSPNITTVYGAGVIDDQFCAAMDYIQGNSIATMLARKEGFSIWDLLDIGRQLTSGFDHAASHNIVHYSLEPSKIMCGWDGTVKILGFGVSAVGNFAHHVTEGLPAILHYVSPEQVQGLPMDGRSNLFSLGAMLYEMVTERRAFDRDDIESLRQSIVESTPVPPIHVNPKVHPQLSDLIMKALAKNPDERYKTGRELLDDLEKCKESKSLPKKEAPKGTMAPPQARAAAQSKLTTSAAAKPAVTPKPSAPAKPAAPAAVAKPAAPAAQPQAKSISAKSAPSKLATPAVASQKPSSLAAPKAAAAAAGVGGPRYDASLASAETQELDLTDHFISTSVRASLETSQPSSQMSSGVADEPQVETFEPQEEEAPRIAVDPMMAEGGGVSASRTSFSEISELPPLKEAYVPPPPPPPMGYQPVAEAPATPTVFQGHHQEKEEKPKVQPREVAQKAIKEIKGVPPKLMMYALGGAGVLILLIGLGVTVYVHSLNGDEDSGSKPAAVSETPAQPLASEPAPKKTPAPAPVDAAPAESQPETPAEPVARNRNSKKKAPAPAMIIPGQIAVDSTPQGAQVQVDGHGESHWVTPFALTNVAPGQHSITVSKPGYSTDTRTVEVTSGNRITSVAHLAQLMATLIVKSDPAGATIYVDGRDVGAKTPAQVSVDKGQHVVLVRMMGYIDETMNAQFVLGQTFNFAPTLRALGNTENLKTVGKMSKLFGGKGVQAGQATVSIRTQPKGAQVAINQHLLDKMSPVDVALDPGNYVVDITLTGYAPVHKIITADKGGKVVVDEVLQRQ